MFILILSFHLTDAFLGMKFSSYGFDVWSYYRRDRTTDYQPETRRPNPMCSVFPTKVYSYDIPNIQQFFSLSLFSSVQVSCTITLVQITGAPAPKSGLCILAQNIVNEKIFLILYFWYIILFVLTILYAIYR